MSEPTANPARVVQPGERIADPHRMIGVVVEELGRDGIEFPLLFTDEVHGALVAAMSEILRLLDVKPAPEMRYEEYVIAARSATASATAPGTPGLIG